MRTRPLLLALLLGACTAGPDFRRPDPWTPAAFRPAAPGPSQPVPEPVDPDWWNALGDPVLTGLMRRVPAGNFDVRAASLRLAQARAQRGIVGAGQYPAVNANAAYTRERPSDNGVLSLFGAGAGSAAAASNGLAGRDGAIPSTTSAGSFDLFQAGFDATWELDFWGRVRRQVESADAQVEASAEARRAALVSTLAEVARTYVQLRNLQDTERIVRANLATARESAGLTASRARGGLATELDVANARAQAEGIAAALPLLAQQQAQAGNAIAFLLGMTPGALAAELSPPRPVPPVPPRVPVGLPSELVRRRPDIRQAEALLHAATADIGAAEADFFPRITLSGSVALQALQVRDLGSWGSRTFGLGPSISIPVFEGGRLRRTLELRKAQQQEAALNYQRAVLQAFHEVDNALLAYGAEQARRARLQAQVAQARAALGLAQARYRQGVSDFLEVLTAQRTLLTAEQQLSDSTAAVSTNLVALYKALGGGWEAALPVTATPAR